MSLVVGIFVWTDDVTRSLRPILSLVCPKGLNEILRKKIKKKWKNRLKNIIILGRPNFGTRGKAMDFEVVNPRSSIGHLNRYLRTEVSLTDAINI